MKKKTAFFLCLAATLAVSPVTAAAADSGIDYSESTETINNPGAGYTSTVWAVCKPGSTPTYDPSSNLVLFFIDIGAFSSGANDSGKDYDLDSSFFESWDRTLQNCYNNGCMVALRFRYDASGKDNPEPETFEKVLSHIEQIKASGLLEKYSDIIAYVESGFVGKWGEQHGGKYTSVKYKAQLLEAMLRAVPSPIPVTVRTPDIFAEWAGITRAELSDNAKISQLTESEYCKDIQADRKRVGLYDDGYMGSNSDLGTYANREIETDWLHEQTFTSYFGGEFSGDIEFAKKYDTYLPENSIKEMYKTHLSYINQNIFKLYNDYTYSADYSTEADTSSYYGQTVHKFMRDHIGYRFVLRDSEISADGKNLSVNFDVENTGFANVIPKVYSYIILEKDGVYTVLNAECDCRSWLSCETTSETVTVTVPDNLREGDWNVYLKLGMGTEYDVKSMGNRSIRFANCGTWNSSIGANYIGKAKISGSGYSGNNAEMFRIGNGITVDGVMSSAYEWTECEEAEKDGLRIAACADEEYLYVMCNAPKGEAAAPVYNLQLNNGDERFWIYYQSNGFIYFNHENRDGCLCKWSDDMVEFRLPLSTLGFGDEIDIKNLRFFMQDSGNDWKLMSDITIPECKISRSFGIISAHTDVTVSEGESYRYTAITDLSGNVGYEWSVNGKVVGNSETIELENVSAEDAGTYSVKIVSESGTEKTFDAFTLSVQEQGEKKVKGDANGDGSLSVADVVTLRNWLLGTGELEDWKNADMDGDGKIDVFDYCRLLSLFT